MREQPAASGHRSGGNFTEPHVELRTHEISFRVVFGWDRQPELYESEAEAAYALRAMFDGELAPMPDPDNWLGDEQIELWLR